MSTDPGLLSVYGPLAAPARTGGPGPYRCGCAASYGESCPACDGTDAEQREYRQATRAERRAYDAGMAAWYLAHPHTDAQEKTA